MSSPNIPRPAPVPTRRWYIESMPRAAAFSALVGCIVSAATWATESFFYRAGESPLIMMFASDVFAGLLSALLVFAALRHLAESARLVTERLNMIAQMNHHVRNALQVISYSAYSATDQQEMMCIRQAAERIEWALSEILGNIQPAGFSKSKQAPENSRFNPTSGARRL